MATFTTLTKNRLNWVAPVTTPNTIPKFLNIGSGYKLLVANGHKLVIGLGERLDTTWTNRNKYS
jgi:hypothetical protein